MVDLWQGSEYASGSKYVRVFNIPWLHRVMNMYMYEYP